MPTKIQKVAINPGSGFSEYYMPTHADLVEGLPAFIDGRLEAARANLRTDGSITFSTSPLNMSLDNNISTVTVTSTGDGALTVTSDDESVAIPHISGGNLTVTAIGPGTATITIIAAQTSSYNEARGYLTVNVSKGSPQLSLSSYSLSLDSSNLADAVIVSRNGTGEISAASSDPSVATISVSGNTVTVTAVGNGNATITVSVAESSGYLMDSVTATVSVQLASTTLNDNSWATISAIAQAGEGDLYWDVGDCKEITLNGNIGSCLNLSNEKLCVFILGFIHPVNGANDNNIIFGGFKTADGTDVALCDSQYGTYPTTGTIAFNMNHSGQTSSSTSYGYYGTNYGGWKGTDFRYDILGATSTAPSQYNQLKSASNVGYDATAATLANPKANTLLAALPSDFRNVLRLWTRYVDNVGNTSNVDANVTACVDAGVSLLTEAEIFASRSYANQYEQNHNTRLAYYVGGNSTIKRKHSDTSAAVHWWESSPYCTGPADFCDVAASGNANSNRASRVDGLAPAFKA